MDTARADDHWTCSFTDVVRVSATGDASGVLVSWGGAEPGAAVVAARTDHDGGLFVDGEDGPALVQAPGYRWFDLGHRNCQPWNVPQSLYEAGAIVSLSALQLDGTIEPIGEVALRSDQQAPPAGMAIFAALFSVPPEEAATVAAATEKPVNVPVLVRVSVVVIVMAMVVWRATSARSRTLV